jgi:endonuclease YncB( thermonuclease family)
MATGLLRVTGSIRLSQFWPSGESDADTIVLDIPAAGAFAFRPAPDSSFQPTDVFYNAHVRGRSGSKPAVDNKNRLHIRLQGVDSPELHYLAHLLTKKSEMSSKQLQHCKDWNKTYRQHYGESAAAALGNELGNQESLPCEVTSAVDEPNDVFDTYARMVGDVFVHLGGEKVHVNKWLVEKGWAYPAFYTSMSKDEIQLLLKAAKTAAAKNIWEDYSSKVGTLETTLLERRSTSHPTLMPDGGQLLFPKLFRRLVEWTVNKKIGLLRDDFSPWLKAKSDKCYLTEEFLNSALTSSSLKQHQFSDFVKGKTVAFAPQDLVFSEEDSTLVGGDGKLIQDWHLAKARMAAA